MSRPTFREWIYRSKETVPARPFYLAAVPLAVLGVIGTPLWLLCIIVPAVGTIVTYLWDTRNE